MRHVTEEQLVLLQYGEAGRETDAIERHLARCAECRAEAEALACTLEIAGDAAVPERDADYPTGVWRRLEPQLEAPAPLRGWTRLASLADRLHAPRLQWAAALALMLVVAFALGRFSGLQSAPTGAPIPEPVRERILLIAVGDHLERSQRLLVELVNSDLDGALDVSETRRRAEALAATNRLYRQSAGARAADPVVADVLEQLERTLLEVANGPPELAAEDLESLRRRIERRGLVFRIRVVGDKVRRDGRDTPSTHGGEV